MNILRLYLGFVHEGPGLPGGPEDFFGDVSRVSFVIKNTLYNAQTLILDGVVVSPYCAIRKPNTRRSPSECSDISHI